MSVFNIQKWVEGSFYWGLFTPVFSLILRMGRPILRKNCGE